MFKKEFLEFLKKEVGAFYKQRGMINNLTFKQDFF